MPIPRYKTGFDIDFELFWIELDAMCYMDSTQMKSTGFCYFLGIQQIFQLCDQYSLTLYR